MNTEKRSTCKARIIGIHPTLILEWFEPVRSGISAAETQLVLPQSEGIPVELEKIAGQRCRPGWHDYIFYPGAVEAQFIAAITDTHGLYFAAHAPAHTPKYLLIMSAVIPPFKPIQSREKRSISCRPVTAKQKQLLFPPLIKRIR